MCVCVCVVMYGHVWSYVYECTSRMLAVSYTCETGQIDRSGLIKQTAGNSKESCAAACDALQECGAFDFTEATIGDACRLAEGEESHRDYGGDHDRKYCTGIS